MMKLLTVEEMLAVERASDAAGHSYAAMLQYAGRSLAKIVHERFRDLHEASVLGVVGKGNNGGDALVALAWLAEWGWEASALLVQRDEDDLVDQARRAGVAIRRWDASDGPGLAVILSGVSVLLDGLLGTGIRLPLRPPADQFLKILGSHLPPGVKVVAVDTPSGIDCDSGETAPESLRADLTVTMAAAKTGLFSHPAFGFVGELLCGDIGLPDGLEAWARIQRAVIDLDYVRKGLPDRPADAHKGTFGTSLICAGSRHYVGAALLAGKAAFRSGAGLVTIACTESIYRMLAGTFPEATWLPLPEESGALGEEAAGLLRENLGRSTSLVMGPGFGENPQTRRFMAGLLAQANQLPPLIVDADGLKLLAGFADWHVRLPGPSILTPHPGEMSVLTGWEVGRVQANRIGTAERFAREWGHVVVLKGAFTVVASPDGRTALVPVSTPALARAGTGDVLAGLIGGLRAQHLGAFEAAAIGAWLHARAGQIAGERQGHTAAVIAGDVLLALPAALAECSKDH